MSMNARMSQTDPRLYNVNRDCAHNYGEVMQEVAKAIEARRWHPLTELAKANKVTDEELGRACQAVIRFIGVQADNPKESMADCLARCGFLAVHPTARVVVMGYLGLIHLGMHFAGVRETTLNGQGPALTYKKLRWYGMKMTKLMSLPRWRRAIYFCRQRLRRAWRALTEKNVYDG